MRTIFVAAAAFAAFVLAPAVAEARPAARGTVQSSIVAPSFDRAAPVAASLQRTRLITERVEAALATHTAQLQRAQRLRLVAPGQARLLQREIASIRTDLRRALRSDRRIDRREEAHLSARLAELDRRVSRALQPRRALLAGGPVFGR